MSAKAVALNVGTSQTTPQTFLQRHAVSIFFVLAFALTWLFQIPLVLDARGMLPFHVPGFFVFLQGPMPGIAALLMAGLVSGRAGVLDLLRRVIRWRVGIVWYVIAIFGSGILYMGAVFGSTLLGGAAPVVPSLSLTLLAGIGIQMAIYLIFNWEDIAWRGFAATRLQATQSALVTAIILGVVEGAFHIPLFFAPTSSQADSPFLSFMLLSIAGVVILNWVFNNTRGSVLLAMLFHAAANTWTDVLPIPPGTGLGWTVWAVVFTVVAVVLVLVYGARYLSRKPDLANIVVVDPISPR